MNIVPAIDRCPSRAPPGLAATANPTFPGPLLDVAPLTMSHGASLAAVHPHCVPDALTVTLPVPPSFTNRPKSALAENLHDALPCVTSSNRPPMTTVPTLDVPVEFAAIDSDTVAAPLVAVRPLTVIQFEKDDALHGQTDWVVRPTVRLEADAPTLVLVVFRLKLQTE